MTMQPKKVQTQEELRQQRLKYFTTSTSNNNNNNNNNQSNMKVKEEKNKKTDIDEEVVRQYQLEEDEKIAFALQQTEDCNLIKEQARLIQEEEDRRFAQSLMIESEIPSSIYQGYSFYQLPSTTTRTRRRNNIPLAQVQDNISYEVIFNLTY